MNEYELTMYNMYKLTLTYFNINLTLTYPNALTNVKVLFYFKV